MSKKTYDTRITFYMRGPNDRRDEASSVGAIIVAQKDAMKAARQIDKKGHLDGLDYSWAGLPRAGFVPASGHGVSINYKSGRQRFIREN